MRQDLLAIIGALLIHAGAFIWWASKVNTLVGVLVTDVNKLKETKEDHADRLTRLEGRKL